ncbi:hypothetical protein [Micromonospora harpali]|uniref:hypothetical protein n=1 Tax=Micromonospora harpali TaxID=1490225 RepID=UPI00366D8BD2
MIRAPSLVAWLYRSNALPLLRFTNTYDAVVSTVAATAADGTTATIPAPSSIASMAAATRGNRPRRRAPGTTCSMSAMSLLRGRSTDGQGRRHQLLLALTSSTLTVGDNTPDVKP